MRSFKILDGGSAEELIRIGKKEVNESPLWSAVVLASDPDAVLTAHKNFLRAGAELVVTASYQASVHGFVEKLGVTEQKAIDLIKNSVHIAKQACKEVSQEKGGRMGLVAGSVGPYGACLHDASEYTGSYMSSTSVEDLKAWHLPRLKALQEAGTDLVATETIPAQKEAEAVVELIEEHFPDLKTYVTFSCKDGEHTCHGEQFSDAIQSVAHSNSVVAVGVNCTAPQYISSLLKSIQHLQLQKPIIVKPNSGESWTATDGWSGKGSCLRVVDLVPEWMELGASWIGGCCRVYPDEIQKIASIVGEISERKSNT